MQTYPNSKHCIHFRRDGTIKTFIITACLVFLFTLPAMCISTGEKAPYFKITSGNSEVLTADMLKDKIAVIFYETKDTKEKNRALKEDLNAFYKERSAKIQKEIMKVAVIRCSAFMPNIWRQSLRENSRKEGMIIYGDWDGAMQNEYGLAAGESNFIIIDKNGIVIYARAGFIPKEDFPAIRNILNGAGE